MQLRRSLGNSALSLAALVVVAGFALPARAATLCVNPGGTGGCFALLEDAIDASRFGDVIDVAAGAYPSPDLLVPASRKLTIRGAGAATTVIAATLGLRERAWVTMSGVRIEGSSDGIYLLDGARLDLVDAEVAGSGSGGITATVHSRVRLTRCTISGNHDIGVRTLGRLDVFDSTVSGNGQHGIHASGAGAVTGSTISGNASGGIYADHDTGSIRVTNSTISGNGGLVGGGIRLRSTGRAILDHVTITANSATLQGGGIAESHTGRFTVRSSVIAGNTAPTGPDCFAAGLRLTVPSLIGDTAGCGITSGAVISADPLLGPLQDNGGPTETHAPPAGSPALDAVTSRAACRGVDQRGVARTVPCDLGAFEVP